MFKRIQLVTGLLVSLAMAGLTPAQASDRNAAIAGAVVGAIVGGVIVANSGNRHSRHDRDDHGYREPPRVVYYERQPVYYQVHRPRYSHWNHHYDRHDRHHRHDRHRRHDHHYGRHGHGGRGWSRW